MRSAGAGRNLHDEEAAMQKLTLDTDGNPEVSSGPVPSCSDAEVLLRARACVLSRRGVADAGETPVSAANGRHLSLGRCFTGIIEKAGGRVEALTPGDRVVAFHTDGGFAEYHSVPAYHVVKLPMGISFEEGAIAALMPTVLNGMERAEVEGRSVFISGAGTTGLLSTQIARISGASTVIAADQHAKRLQRARDVGADTVINVSTEDAQRRVMDQTGGIGVDVCLECAGNETSFFQCAAMLRPGGKLVVLKPVTRPVSIEMQAWSERSLQLIMGREQPFETVYLVERGLKLVGIGAVRLRPLLTHVFPVHRIAEALELIDGHPNLAVEVALIRA